jgi:membrane-associated phospholipid phosphatase
MVLGRRQIQAGLLSQPRQSNGLLRPPAVRSHRRAESQFVTVIRRRCLLLGDERTVIATWLIAVPIFALFPVAPPRLAGVGISDTVSSHSAIALTGPSTLFYNPYAAVPSLHVGLAFAVGIAAAVALRARWARVLALSWGPLVTLSVLATGNHYLFEVAAGLLVTGVGFSAGRLTTRPVQQRPGVRSVRRLIPATRS